MDSMHSEEAVEGGVEGEDRFDSVTLRRATAPSGLFGPIRTAHAWNLEWQDVRSESVAEFVIS